MHREGRGTESSTERLLLLVQTVEAGPAMTTLLKWAIIALVVALVAAILGFGGIAGAAAWRGAV